MGFTITWSGKRSSVTNHSINQLTGGYFGVLLYEILVGPVTPLMKKYMYLASKSKDIGNSKWADNWYFTNPGILNKAIMIRKIDAKLK